MPPKSHGYLLPEVIDPERVCVQLFIPNDPQHIRAFWGAILELTNWWNWDRDDNQTGAAVAAVWRDVWERAYEKFWNSECGDVEGCREYFPSSNRIAWYPVSPYDSTTELPSGYTHRPFTVVDSSVLSTIISVWGLGYQVGDVYTDLTKLPSGSWENLILTWEFFPRFEVLNLNGAGKVKLNLLNIPQGGRLFIVKDGVVDLLNLQLVEQNKDLVSIPAETQTPFTVEIEFENGGEHTLQCAFLPTVDDTPVPVFFGGGLRSIEICGFDIEGGCMTDCCDETNRLLSVNNQTLLKIMDILKNGFEIKPIEALLGDSLPPVCVPIGYDSDTGDSGVEAQRLGALCYTITAYVEAVMLKAFRKMLMPIDMLLTIMPNFDDLPPQFRDVEIDLFAGATLAALIAGYTNNDAKTLLKCTMQQALEGQINSFDIFKNSVKAANNTDYVTRFLWIMIEQANQSVKNWNLFGQVLNWAFELPDIENFACPCVVDSCVSADDIILVADTPNTTLEKLTANTWRVISTYKPLDDPARPEATAAAIKDQYGRCVDFVSFTQTQSDGTTWDCSGQPTYSIGGQGGIAEKVGWRLWDGTTIDTVVTIDCVS